ncbi:MAG: radical SAM protein [Terrimicrobiaceae bacterium]
MIDVTKLLCGTQRVDGAIRGGWLGATGNVSERKPVVVWRITRRCNLRCVRCASDSAPKHYPGELTLDQMVAVVDDLSGSRVPAVLFSGGEPMLHPHFFDVAGYAVERGLQVTVSTNGTRVDSHAAERLKDLGVAYVGISLDGTGENHDRFRGRPGAFKRAVEAFRHCRGTGQKSVLRLNLTRETTGQLAEIFRFIEEEEIPRVCIHHLDGDNGRGAGGGLLPAAKARRAMRMVADAVLRWHREGDPREVFALGQPADAVFFWLLMRRRDAGRADAIWRALKRGGRSGCAPGLAISSIDSQGNVHPGQCCRGCKLGNVKDRPFSVIWKKSQGRELFSEFRDRLPRLKGRCGQCRFRGVCGGGLRVRAFQKSGDVWAEDPGCYLRDYEIAAS